MEQITQGFVTSQAGRNFDRVSESGRLRMPILFCVLTWYILSLTLELTVRFVLREVVKSNSSDKRLFENVQIMT